MTRLIITANGNYNVPVPTGRGFTIACSGTFDGATITAQYNTGQSSVVAAYASGTLTGTTIGAADTVTIGDVDYTFIAALTNPAVPYEVLVGASDSASLDNLIAAINATEGQEGVLYGEGTVAHPLVQASAGAGDTMIVTAVNIGEDANDIATTASLTSGQWGAATLTGGLSTGVIDNYVPFSTTAIALNAAGEKSGVNVGAHNEINLAVTGKSGTTAEIIAIVNCEAL